MAGIGESEKSLSAAKTLLAEMETNMSRIEKRTSALNAIKFSEQISAGNISLKETEEIYSRLGDDVDAVSEELLDIVDRTEKTKAATSEWADQVNNVSKNLLGISLPTLTITGLLTAAVNTTIDWYNRTFEVRRQLYDINAALGEAGTKSSDFRDIIGDTALAFHVLPDEVRNVVDGLADIGMNSDDIKDTLDDVFALTRNWSDVTPEKQMSLMSDYMKEFGMSGKEAWATMNSLYTTSQDLRKDLPNLDIQKFVDQTQSVALSMRKYGLETQDAIAMTSTLARIGVEQARIPEIAERMGSIGLQQAPETAFMAQRFLKPSYQRELSGLQAGRAGKEGPKTERETELERLIGIMNSGVIGMIGVMETAPGEDRVKAQMGMFESMLGTVGVTLSDPIEKIVGGLTAVDLPGIGKMNIQSAKEFADAAKAMQEEKGISLTDALKESYVKTVESTEDKAKEAAKQREAQIETAKKVAGATITTAEKIAVIAQNTKDLAQFLIEGKRPDNRTPEEKAAAATLRESEKSRLLRSVPGSFTPKRSFKTDEVIQSEIASGERYDSGQLTEEALSAVTVDVRVGWDDSLKEPIIKTEKIVKQLQRKTGS